MKIYTRTGDLGETSLFGGQRVSKNHSRIDAYGTVDELNSLLGVVRASKPDPTLDKLLYDLQNDLFVLGADLATPSNKPVHAERIGDKHISRLEQEIDRLEPSMKPLKTFILPGGSPGASNLHHARTVCRRAERICISCRKTESLSDETLKYLNRLSDLLFVMARFENHSKKIPDVPWKMHHDK